MRTVRHSPHRFDAFCLHVSLPEVIDDDVPEASGEIESKDDAEETEVIINVKGMLPSKDHLWDYFENTVRSGGVKVLSIKYTDESEAVITFSEVKGNMAFLSLCIINVI